MADKVSIIIGLAISLILMGVLLPIGLADLVNYTGAYNATHISGTTTSYAVGTNATIATLVATVLPIMIVIGIVLALVKNRGSE